MRNEPNLLLTILYSALARILQEQMIRKELQHFVRHTFTQSVHKVEMESEVLRKNHRGRQSHLCFN